MRLKAEKAARRRLYGHYRNKYTDDPSVSNLPQRDNTGNTNAFAHHGELFMLREDSLPFRVDPATLETLGEGEFSTLRSTALTAHPKIDPLTGEWWSYGVFAGGEPTTDASLHVFDQHGALIREQWFHTPFPGLSHDWGITREHIVLPIMPLVASAARLRAGGPFYQYDPDLTEPMGDNAARWRSGAGHALVFHARHGHGPCDERLFARQPGDHRHPAQPRQLLQLLQRQAWPLADLPETITQITRITFDLDQPDAEAVTLQPLAGALGDMPKIDDRFAMQHYRTGYFALRDFPAMGMGQIDWDRGTLIKSTTLLAGAARQEPLFVPRHPDAAEGDGFILTAVDRLAEKRTDLLILDGNDVSRPPLATIKLPFALPMAFHGSWIPA